MTHKANTLEELYQAHLNTWSDMQHHMGILRYFASKCETVLELGMRAGVSTCALLAGGPSVMSVDIVRNDVAVKQLEWLCGDRFRFLKDSSLFVEQDADLILFDTKHTYTHLKAELERHSPSAARYMIFHDTCTFRNEGEDGTKPGLLAAIAPYTMPHAAWKTLLDIDNCCGLMVLERK